jgi:hypothetical protein
MTKIDEESLFFSGTSMSTELLTAEAMTSPLSKQVLLP